MINPITLSEQLLFSTVRIETEISNDEGSVGTGFFFNYEFTDQKTISLIITNKHVVKGALRGSFFCHEQILQDGKLIPSDNSFPVILDNFKEFWISHPDNHIDLCAMPFKPIKKAAEKNGKEIYRVDINKEHIWSDKKLEELSAVEEILMVGYPNGLWDEVNNMPLVRKGITSYHPAMDFEGKSIGIIDAACFPGSSGSPVSIINETYYTIKTGTTFSTRTIFLGVLFAGPVLKEEGEIIVKIIPTNKKSVSITEIPIHLGYYIKAKEVLTLAQYIIDNMDEIKKPFLS